MKNSKSFTVPILILISLVILTISCKKELPRREVALYSQYCASCHIAPRIDELPKNIWANSVLPDMLTKMKIEEEYEDPNAQITTYRPIIKLNDWIDLKNYIIELAPEKLETHATITAKPLELFEVKKMALDSQNGALLTYIEFNAADSKLYFGDIAGKLSTYNFSNKKTNELHQGKIPITWFNKTDSLQIITEVGILDPSELERGQLIAFQNTNAQQLKDGFHRPVHTVLEDLNSNGKQEIVVSEFGDVTGMLSLLVKNDSSYEKKVLLNQPGCIRTLIKDMNKDERLDIITMTTQSDESITILYQTENLKFRAEKVLEFSPIYGSSWFELVDYNGDGFDDIITVNGDNADKSYVNKPYHGMRIHLNDGQNNFTEAYFYPLYGTTRLLARDFDQDGDIDFGLISTFPDYENAPERSFVYLDNLDSENFEFATKTLIDPGAGRWFLMDAGDIDSDGDEDIILSSFTYTFTPVPDELAKRWAQTNVDILVLENKLN